MSETFDLTIDGAGVATAASFAVLDPTTGRMVAEAPDATARELDLAVAAARRAFPAWSALPQERRADFVAKIATIIAGHEEELAELDLREGGKPRAVARQVTALAGQWAGALAGLHLSDEVRDRSADRTVEVIREPLGVVGAIAPWNFPLLLSVWKVASALMAGCTVVLKPSPFAPLAVLRLGALVRDLLPPGVLNVLSGGDALGPLMTAHPGIDKISFTGSTATGRRVMAGAAPTLKRLTLELGGNDAAVVFPDVDVDVVAQTIFWAAMGNSGQACIATKRVYVHEAIYDAFLAAMIRLVEECPVGPPDLPGTALGPLQNRPQYERVRDLLRDCAANGHRLHRGRAPEGDGLFVAPTIVDRPPHDSRIVQEEQFGPILPLLAFSDEETVTDLVNDTTMGLSATIWTRDIACAERLARRLDVGSVWINEANAISPFVPFGGHKQSGLGVENALEGILEYTKIKAVTTRRL